MSSGSSTGRGHPQPACAGGPTTNDGQPGTTPGRRRRRHRRPAHRRWHPRRARRGPRQRLPHGPIGGSDMPRAPRRGRPAGGRAPARSCAAAGSRASSRASEARYAPMSPSGGEMTTVDPCITWSPENRSALVDEQVAEVVRSVPGRVHRAQHVLGGCDGVTVGERVGDGEAVAGTEGQHSRSGLGGDLGGGRPVVEVRVGAHDATDAAASGGHDGGDVAGVGRAGVEHGHVVVADQVGVGAGTGHRSRVGSQDAADQRREARRHADLQRIGVRGGGRLDRGGSRHGRARRPVPSMSGMPTVLVPTGRPASQVEPARSTTPGHAVREASPA